MIHFLFLIQKEPEWSTNSWVKSQVCQERLIESRPFLDKALPLEVLDIVWPEAAVATSLDGLTDADTAQTFQILGQFCILSARPAKEIAFLWIQRKNNQTMLSEIFFWKGLELVWRVFAFQGIYGVMCGSLAEFFKHLLPSFRIKLSEPWKSQVSACWSLSNVLHGFLETEKTLAKKVVTKKTKKGRYICIHIYIYIYLIHFDTIGPRWWDREIESAERLFGGQMSFSGLFLHSSEWWRRKQTTNSVLCFGQRVCSNSFWLLICRTCHWTTGVWWMQTLMPLVFWAARAGVLLSETNGFSLLDSLALDKDPSTSLNFNHETWDLDPPFLHVTTQVLVHC